MGNMDTKRGKVHRDIRIDRFLFILISLEGSLKSQVKLVISVHRNTLMAGFYMSVTLTYT